MEESGQHVGLADRMNRSRQSPQSGHLSLVHSVDGDDTPSRLLVNNERPCCAGIEFFGSWSTKSVHQRHLVAISLLTISKLFDDAPRAATIEDTLY